MIEIYIDGLLTHSTAAEDEAHIALDVKPSLDIEDSSSLSFVLPPGNAQYDAIMKMKSIVTLYQDDALLFRGRVTECTRDNFNQKTVYCEGDRSFLNDSLWEERTFSGTSAAFFRALIDNHNAQVEPEKQFTVGIITAVSEETPYEGEQRIEARRLWDTATILDDRLVSVHGGYIRTRMQDKTAYIDWLKDFEEESEQEISFTVNLLDLTDKLDASGVFTVLIPLGYSEIGEDGTYEDPVNIKSVNGGVEYIQNDEAVALYGKIWRSRTWANTKDPAKLLEKGHEYLRTGLELRTLEIKAVDMHLTDREIQMIRIGTKVHITSDPHGIDVRMVCAKIDPDYDKPENTTFTFGVKPRTLTEATIRNEKETGRLSGRGGGGGRGIDEELGDIYRWARVSVDEANANINLNAGEINKVIGRMSQAEIDIDGINANILLKADVTVTDELGRRVSSAEIEIDGLNSEINLKADKVTVDAEIADLSTALTDMRYAIAESMSTKALTVSGNAWVSGTLTAVSLSAGGLTLDGHGISLKEATFLTSSTSLTVNSTGGTVTGVTLNKKTNTINYLGW